MEVMFDLENFHFHRSGVIVVERLKNGISNLVHAVTHEPFTKALQILI